MDWTDALKAFKDANPDLPEGNDVPQTPADTPKHPRLDIAYERKGRAGKPATVIVGFECDDDELRAIASELKSKLATGGSARGGEILLQGDRRNQSKQLLEKMGFKARII